MSNWTVELNDTNFDSQIQNGITLVDFWAPWCGPCRMMTPIIEQVATEYTGKAKICKVNTDESRNTAVKFGINAIPTLILFKGGQVQKKWVGVTSKKDISDTINGLL